jgi:hypothetical protein
MNSTIIFSSKDFTSSTGCSFSLIFSTTVIPVIKKNKKNRDVESYLKSFTNIHTIGRIQPYNSFFGEMNYIQDHL